MYKVSKTWIWSNPIKKWWIPERYLKINFRIAPNDRFSWKIVHILKGKLINWTRFTYNLDYSRLIAINFWIMHHRSIREPYTIPCSTSCRRMYLVSNLTDMHHPEDWLRTIGTTQLICGSLQDQMRESAEIKNAEGTEKSNHPTKHSFTHPQKFSFNQSVSR